MNAIWIILWVSSQPIVVNDVHYGVELIDHSSLRESREAAYAWRRELREHGVGMDFHIFKAKEESESQETSSEE